MRTLLTTLVWFVVALPASAQQRAFVERFDTSDSSLFPPLGWVEIQASKNRNPGWENTSTWPVSQNWLGPNAAGHDDFKPGVFNDSWLISPPVDLTDYATPRLVFDESLGFAHNLAHHPDFVGDGVSQVLVSSDGLTWTVAWTESRIEDGRYLCVEVPMDSMGGMPAVTVAFRYAGTYAHTWVIDNVIIDGGDTGMPTLTVDGGCGLDTVFELSNMTPRGGVVTMWSFECCPTMIEEGPCSGEFIPIQQPRLAFRAIADDWGTAEFAAYVPPAACGKVFVNGYDVESCTTTNVVAF